MRRFILVVLFAALGIVSATTNGAYTGTPRSAADLYGLFPDSAGSPRNTDIRDLIASMGTAAVTSAESLGADPSASLGQNVVAIQAALNRKGLVTITKQGNYQIGANSGDCILFIGDDTTLYLGPGVVIQSPADPTPGRAMICNSNAASNRVGNAAMTSITATFNSPAPLYCTVVGTAASTANFPTVGQYVLIKNDTSKKFNDIFKVTAVNLAAKTITWLQPCTVALGSATGSPVVYVANANIRILGEGLWDFSYNTTAGSSYLSRFLIFLNKVADIEISTSTIHSTSRGIQICNIYRAYVHDLHSLDAGITIQGTGPLNEVNVFRSRSSAAASHAEFFTDDPTGVQFHDADNTQNSGGDIDGLTLDTLMTWNGTRTAAVGAENGHRVDRFIARNLNRRGGGGSSVIELSNGTGTGTYGSVVLEDLWAEPDKNANIVNVIGTAGTTVNIDSLEIIRPHVHTGYGGDTGLASSGGAQGVLLAVGSASVTMSIKHLLIADGYIALDAANSTGSSAAIFLNLATIEQVVVRNMQFVTTGTTQAYDVMIINSGAGNVKRVVMDGNRAILRSGSLVNQNQTTSIPNIYLTNNIVDGVDGSNKCNGLMVPAQSTNVTMIGNELGSNTNAGLIKTDTAAASTVVNITIGGNKTTQVPVFPLGTSITYNFRCLGGNELTDQGTSTGTTSTWNFINNCSDVKIDVGGTGISKTNTGGSVFNTGAGRGTLVQNQPVFSDGANWRQITPLNSF